MSEILEARLPPEPVYLPFAAGPYKMTMGLLACESDDLIRIDRHYHSEMAQRRELIATMRGEVLATLPEARDAAAEVLDWVAEILPRRHPDWFSRDGGRLRNHLTGEDWDLDDPACDPLEVAGLLVQEDLCLLQLVDGVPHLTGAVLCFPGGWRLLDKLGLPLATVHAPVPIYPDRLARPVDRLIAQLKPGKLVERVNWAMSDSPGLFRTARHNRREKNLAITPENAGETLFLRVERQTLNLMPRSGAVLFGIHTYVYPLGRIAGDPAVAARLASAVRGLPPELQLYKSIAVFAEPMLAFLDARAAG